VADYAATAWIDLAHSWLSEGAPLARLQPGPGRRLNEWPDEDLRQIRLVLRKLTALRVDNADDAEDLVQDTLVTMAEKCAQIELEKGLLIWGMGILRKKIGNYYRKSRRYVPLDQLPSAEDPRREGRPARPGQESLLHHAELRALVHRVLENMAPRERIALELYLEGTPTHEIADLLFPERYQNIVNWLHRGRKKLARELAKHGYTNGNPGT